LWCSVEGKGKKRTISVAVGAGRTGDKDLHVGILEDGLLRFEAVYLRRERGAMRFAAY
jgi:hypothetical protein